MPFKIPDLDFFFVDQVGPTPDLRLRCSICGVVLDQVTWSPFTGGGICPKCLRDRSRYNESLHSEHEQGNCDEKTCPFCAAYCEQEQKQAEEEMPRRVRVERMPGETDDQFRRRIDRENQPEREYRPDDIHISLAVCSDGSFEVVREKYEGPHFGGLSGALNKKELEYLVTHGARLLGWESGPNLQLNPQNLPSRAKLEAAYTTTIDSHPLSKGEPAFRRFLQALAMLTAYVPWLPNDHRKSAERDIKYIERRMEELVMHRRFLVEFLAKYKSGFTGRISPSEMYATVVNFLKMLKETVGVDLLGEDDPSKP